MLPPDSSPAARLNVASVRGSSNESPSSPISRPRSSVAEQVSDLATGQRAAEQRRQPVALVRARLHPAAQARELRQRIAEVRIGRPLALLLIQAEVVEALPLPDLALNARVVNVRADVLLIGVRVLLRDSKAAEAQVVVVHRVRVAQPERAEPQAPLRRVLHVRDVTLRRDLLRRNRLLRGELLLLLPVLGVHVPDGVIEPGLRVADGNTLRYALPRSTVAAGSDGAGVDAGEDRLIQVLVRQRSHRLRDLIQIRVVRPRADRRDGQVSHVIALETSSTATRRRRWTPGPRRWCTERPMARAAGRSTASLVGTGCRRCRPSSAARCSPCLRSPARSAGWCRAAEARSRPLSCWGFRFCSR